MPVRKLPPVAAAAHPQWQKPAMHQSWMSPGYNDNHAHHKNAMEVNARRAATGRPGAVSNDDHIELQISMRAELIGKLTLAVVGVRCLVPRRL